MAGFAAFQYGVWQSLRSVSSLLPSKSAGELIFENVTEVLAAFAVVSGFRSHDCISKEKREGTLGLLFLTDLKGSDIVLGKFVASAVPAIYTAMGALPVLSVALLLGGVTARQFWRHHWRY